MKEQKSEVEVSSRGSWWPAFVAGLLLGSLASAAMLLLAPRAWEKSRSKIQKQGAELREQTASSMDELVKEAGGKAHRITKRMDQGVTDLQQNAQDMIGEVRK